MELDTNNYSVFSMHYHLILVVKYRKKVIDNNISDRLKEIFEYISQSYKIDLQEWNHDKDHNIRVNTRIEKATQPIIKKAP